MNMSGGYNTTKRVDVKLVLPVLSKQATVILMQPMTRDSRLPDRYSTATRLDTSKRLGAPRLERSVYRQSSDSVTHVRLGRAQLCASMQKYGALQVANPEISLPPRTRNSRVILLHVVTCMLKICQWPQVGANQIWRETTLLHTAITQSSLPYTVSW